MYKYVCFVLTLDNDVPASVQNTRASASSAEVGLLFFYFVFGSRNL